MADSRCACLFSYGVVLMFCFCFFFSSRRRHTRCLSDWSSDVCSSDLAAEAYAPLYAALQRLGFVLLAALAFAVLAGMFLARRMVGPIQALRTGAAQLGSGGLSQRIAIKTGDELEALAHQFNAMAGQLQESYAGLEQKVEERTHELQTRSRELAQSVGELRALGEVTQAVNSTLDLATVLSTIVAKAVELSGTEAGSIYVVD